jgi:hypothetical protein
MQEERSLLRHYIFPLLLLTGDDTLTVEWNLII